MVTTLPVLAGHTDFHAQVVGSSSLEDWTHPVFLIRNGNDWTLPPGQSANFFRLRLGE